MMTNNNKKRTNKVKNSDLTEQMSKQGKVKPDKVDDSVSYKPKKRYEDTITTLTIKHDTKDKINALQLLIGQNKLKSSTDVIDYLINNTTKELSSEEKKQFEQLTEIMKNQRKSS